MTAAYDEHPPGTGTALGCAVPSGSSWPQPGAPSILVIDDEPRIHGMVRRALEHVGYRVDVAADAADGVIRASQRPYGLVILDLIMPDRDGREVLAEILRANPVQPVMMLSCSSDVRTKVECLDLGARDYLTKPFSLAELVARVRVRLRDSAAVTQTMRAGRLTLDAGKLTADCGAGPVALTRLEFLVLRALIERTGELVTKNDLLASVWGINFDPGSNIVDVCIRRLRAKLGFGLIETVRGEGYRLAV